MNVVTADQMREIDRAAIEGKGIPGAELMDRAGRAIAEAVASLLEPGDAVLVLSGKGNNGGDGFTAARYLAQSGFAVHVVPVLGTDGLTQDAQGAFDKMPKDTVKVHKLPEPGALWNLVDGADAIVDAMLGTGSKPPLHAPLDWIVRLVNDAKIPVVAADIPTGLDANTGEGDLVVRATRTVTMGLPKRGMLTPAGVTACGAVRVDRLDFPPELLDDAGITDRTMTMAEAAELLPVRPIDGHKGTFGTVAVCAGSARLPGAAALAGLGALRSGAGLVRMHVPGAVRPVVAGLLPEVTFHIGGGESRSELTPLAYSEWDSLLLDPNALVFGPGVTMHDGPHAFMVHLLDTYKGPTVIDADGLNLLAAHKDIAGAIHSNVVLTPHPGEMARLLRRTTDQVQKNRWEAAREAAKRFNCTVAFKGWGTLVATPDGVVTHVPTGNTALSRGGSGDLLAGMIGGLMAQKLAPTHAACLGAFVVGMAADIVVRDVSARGVLVRESADKIPLAFRELETLKKP
ncbi:MAG: ADP-dependent NAD(P)H-hydrate dehydratase / NAD(P)H-hydrate epimerase [Candidatus Sumerlaeota bacterium]|nr:ADP-dependent NAD(P)H-hydrate dehydratase / NAD(P)H-hydrate epimerase [Candidatus Sumerlaeota bacterium]